MSEPDFPPLDPDDPGWVEAILARARDKAEEQFGTPAAATPVVSTPPAVAAPATPPSPLTPWTDEPSALRPSSSPAVIPPAAVPTRASAPTPTPASTPDESPWDAPQSRASSTGSRLSPDASQPAPDASRPDVSGPDVSGPDVSSGPRPLPPVMPAESSPRSSTRTIVEWLFVAVGALVVAFLIRQFLVQAFYIPSESMEPTLMVGDRLLVNKLSYKAHDVRRGDIVVFETPPNVDIAEKDLIKRVVALPGETIELRDGTIYIDDRQLTEPYTAPGSTTTGLGWVQGCANPQSEVNRCTVPAGHVFVMGDNRNHSRDGRVFGPISEDLIVGRAFLRVWPLPDFGVL